MLQQTQVKTVLPYWERWMRELPTMEALANASSGKIHKLWAGLGYYTRVRNMQKAARVIVEKHGGRFPEEFNEVLALPGIGRYTAGAICSIAFNQPTPILDGNVMRVLTRIFGIGENPREKETKVLLWRLAEDLVACAGRGWGETPGEPAREYPSSSRRCGTSPGQAARPTHPCSHLNQSLMELGALVCTPRQPKCGICPVARNCVACRQNRVGQLPNLGPRVSATRRRFAAFVVKHQGRFLVRQRPAGVVNAQLWEFPNVELIDAGADLRQAARKALGFTPRSLKKLCAIRHSITRYRIALEAFKVGGGHNGNIPRTAGCWFKPPELAKLPFPSAHKRIFAHLCESELP